MRSGGPELGGAFYIMRCTSNVWEVTAPNPDITPDPFSLTDQTDVAVSTLIESNTVTITGIDAPTSVSIAGAGSPQFRIAGGGWVTSGTIQNGQSLEVRLTSDPSFNTMRSATVTVGTASDQWDVTTVFQDITPDAFAFTNQTDVALSTLITSNAITITGITGDVTVWVSGAGSPQIRINGGGWGTSGTIQDGQSLEVRLTSNASFSTMNSAIVTVGIIYNHWDVTTETGGPTGCPNIGDICSDGSLFAGDGNMYVTDIQQGSSMWKATLGNNDIEPNSNTDGAANHANVQVPMTDLLAMNICETLNLHGHTDWYLPALSETGVLQTNRAAIEANATEGFGPGGAFHWSSTELGTDKARARFFLDGSSDILNKDSTVRVRCVRREPDSCPNIGDLCSDGSVYAGLSPDGNVAMYTMPADAAGTYTWNNGTSNEIDTAMVNCTSGTPGTATSCQTGEANTALLAGLSDADSPYEAAEYCDGLSAHDHTDWYLPASDELDLLYDNRVAIGGFSTSLYWSSSEHSSNGARAQRFSDGHQNGYGKHNPRLVRCVRKD